LHSHGVRANLEGVLLDLAGNPLAERWFNKAVGYWPDPMILLTVAAWQRRRGDAALAASTLQPLEEHPVRTMRHFFPGLTVIGWVEQAQCLATLSRFEDALRLYQRALNHWQVHAGRFGQVREVRQQYMRVIQQSKENHHG
jgi:hypothetical protein